MFVGIVPNSKASTSFVNLVAPPTQHEPLSLRLIPPNGNEGPTRARKLAREYRTSVTDGQTFTLVLHTSTGAPVTLAAKGLRTFGHYAVALAMPSSGRTVNLRERPAVTLQPRKSSTRLTLHVGSAAYVEAKSRANRPVKTEVRSNYPNPFHAHTTVEYALPQRTEVQLFVYDVLGRRISTLVDEVQEPGIHRIQWQGRSQSGQSVASGLYFLRLHADGEVHTSKAVLVR